MLKMVFSQNLLYFASLIVLMEGLYLDNDFRTLFLSFCYFYSCRCYFVDVLVVVSGSVIIIIIIIIIIVIIIIIIIYFS